MYIYIYTYIPSRFKHRTTCQVLCMDFAREDIPRYILEIKENLISRNTSQQLLPRVAIPFFCEILSQTFHL